MSRRAWSGLAVAVVGSVAGVLACDAVLGLHDPTAAPDAGDAAPERAGVAVPPDGGSCPDEQTACASGCTSLASDPWNCGACTHSCLGAACQSGLCQPATLALPGPGPVRGIASSATTLYVMTDDQLLATSFDPDASTGLPPFVPVLALDAGTFRSLVVAPSGVVAAIAPGDTVLLWNGASSQTLADDAGDPLSVTAAGDSVFWASSDPSATTITAFQAPGPPSTLVTLQPGDGPCSLTASLDGVFWTSARGTFTVGPEGGAPLALTHTAFDNAVAPAGGGRAFVADGQGALALVDPTSVPRPIPLPGAVRAVVPVGTFTVAAGDGVYAVSVAPDGVVQLVVTLAVGAIPGGCHATVLAAIGSFVAWVDAATGTVRYVSATIPAFAP